MKIVKIKQVDAFTDAPFKGNPAGVVTSASGLTVKQMKLISREMNLSETAFILPPKTPSATMKLRWFTPTSEVDLCGHATIASFHALAEEKKYGMTRKGRYKFRVETQSGILPVEVEVSADKPSIISFGLPIPQFKNIACDKNELCKALAASPENFLSKFPIARDNFQMVVPFKNREALFNLRPNFPMIENICRSADVGALTVFTTDTVDEDSKVHTRCFVPLFGVNEDPVTGSSLGPLGIYLAEHGIVTGSGNTIRFVAEQGDCLEKPGRVTIEIIKNRNVYQSLMIQGCAVTVLTGEIHLE